MKKHLLALALISGAFVSCTDDSYDLDNISNDFRIGLNEYLPIAHSSVKLKDMLDEFKSEYIEEDEDNKLYFVFDTITRVDIKPFEINIEKISYDFETQVEVVDGKIAKNSQYTFEIPVNLGFDDENGVGRIDSVHVKDCTLGFYVDGDNINTGDLYLRFSSTYITNMQSAGTSDKSYWNIILKDSWLKFDENGDLFVTCTVTAGEDIPVNGKDFKLSVVCDKAQLSYHSIWGSLKSNVAQNDYTDFYINLYDDNLDFDLEVKDPKLTISANTNCGMPLACTVKGFVGKHKSKKSSVKDSVKATFKNGQDTLDINVDYAKTPGEFVPAFHEEFDNVNGSLGKIFSYLPDSVKVRSSFRVNSDVNDEQSYFLLDSTYLDVNINARIPLHIGQKSYLTINDTIDGIDIEKEIEDYKKSDFGVEKAEVILQLENKLPLEAIVDIKFCDVDTVAGVPHFYEFKSIHQSVKVNSASVVDKRSGSSIPTKKTIKVDDTMLEDIKHIKAICFKYTIKVPTGVDEDGILLTSDCGLSASAYAHVKANITNSEDK